MHKPHRIDPDINAELRVVMFELRNSLEALTGYLLGSKEWIYATNDQIERHDRILMALSVTLVVVVAAAAAMIVRTDLRVDTIERRVSELETTESAGRPAGTWEAVTW